MRLSQAETFMTTPARTALYCPHNELLATVQQLATHYNLPISTLNDDTYDYLLVIVPWQTSPGYLCQLQKTGKKPPGPVLIDFCRGQSAHRRQFGGGRKQTLARAVGIKPGVNPRILDLTAGLGKDAFVLASLGCHVSLIERNPWIFLLLENAIERARQDEETTAIMDRLNIRYADSKQALAETDPSSADVIYLDPMYPAREKSALVKKEMRYFHDIAGQDEDAASLLHSALKTQIRRIAVKRPINAEPLAGLKPDTIISSKNTRYDIYLHRETRSPLSS